MLRSLVTVCAAVVMFVPSSLLASDTVLIHGHIYTGNPKMPWAQALIWLNAVQLKADIGIQVVETAHEALP